VTDTAYEVPYSNVALNRPAFMSSVYSGGQYGAFVASRAVDGNRDSEFRKVGSSCIATQREPDPWWAVDLETALVVVGIIFTNRGDDYGNICTIGYKQNNYCMYAHVRLCEMLGGT